MKIDHAQLAAFAAVLHEGSFEAAARVLHVTPSAISQRIRLLEDRLGQVLVRRGSPCEPTTAGRALLRFADQMDLLEGELLRDLGTFVEGEDSPVRIPVAVNADSLDGWFLEAMKAVSGASTLTFDIRVEDQEYSATLLREGNVMAAVSASPQPIQGCRVEYLGNMRYRALAAPGFAACHFPCGVDADTLQCAAMLVFNRKDNLQRNFVRLFTEDAVSPPTHYLPSTHGFIDVACSGLGWGMFPEDMVRAQTRSGELVEIAPGRHMDVPLYWHTWRFDSPTLAQVSHAVRQAAGICLRQEPPAE